MSHPARCCVRHIHPFSPEYVTQVLHARRMHGLRWRAGQNWAVTSCDRRGCHAPLSRARGGALEVNVRGARDLSLAHAGSQSRVEREVRRPVVESAHQQLVAGLELLIPSENLGYITWSIILIPRRALRELFGLVGVGEVERRDCRTALEWDLFH